VVVALAVGMMLCTAVYWVAAIEACPFCCYAGNGDGMVVMCPDCTDNHRCLVGLPFLNTINQTRGFAWANDRKDPNAPPKWGLVAKQVPNCAGPA
jgi:hypothetical protein